MSYLLTEIALEMLGYKYYDIDGAPGQTNFQNGPRADCAEPVEESLEGLLGLTRKVPSERNNINVNGTHTKTMPTETTPIDTENESTPTPSSSHNKGKAAIVNLTKRPCEEFRKQLDIEYGRITAQIQRHKLHYTQANARVAKRIERGSVTTKEFLQPFIKQEKENLEKEMKVMCDFRKLVERGVATMNPAVLEKYHGVFNPNDQ